MQLIQGGRKQLLDVEAHVKRKFFDYILGIYPKISPLVRLIRLRLCLDHHQYGID